MTSKNANERAKMVRAMEYITRHINDEGIFMSWLYCGVADGDIEYGDLNADIDEYYLENDNFADLMSLFLKLMSRAKKSGGLYCGGVISADKN